MIEFLEVKIIIFWGPPYDWIPLDFFFYYYCSGFCHTLKCNSHGFTCVPHPDPPSHLLLHPIPLGLPSAPGLSACLMHPTWAGELFHPRSYTFQCCALETSHPRLLPQSLKDCSIHLLDFFSQNYPQWISSNSSITFQVFLPRHWFLWWFPILSFCSWVSI